MTEFLALNYTGVEAPDFQAKGLKGRVPQHVAVVMDGNGRWANQRGLTRVEGHKAGESALLDVVAGAIQALSTFPSTPSVPRTGNVPPMRCASSWVSIGKFFAVDEIN
jgi:undecaprenyl pyrophosphate synthase